MLLKVIFFLNVSNKSTTLRKATITIIDRDGSYESIVDENMNRFELITINPFVKIWDFKFHRKFKSWHTKEIDVFQIPIPEAINDNAVIYLDNKLVHCGKYKHEYKISPRFEHFL